MDLFGLLTALSDDGQVRAFQAAFDLASSGRSTDRGELASIGRYALESLLQRNPNPDIDDLKWFAERTRRGVIAPSQDAYERLLGLEARLNTASRTNRDRTPPPQTVLSVKRVVQLSWFGLAGFQASDHGGAKTCVFRSPQERTFFRALRERFPGLLVLPNYPLDQVASLDRLADVVAPASAKYAASCRLDAVLVTPIEGDPVACFELDSRIHLEQRKVARDKMRNELLAAAALPLFRLRASDPTSTTVDEWYQLLTDEVLPKLDIGNRIRNRDTHSVLVPLS